MKFIGTCRGVNPGNNWKGVPSQLHFSVFGVFYAYIGLDVHCFHCIYKHIRHTCIHTYIHNTYMIACMQSALYGTRCVQSYC